MESLKRVAGVEPGDISSLSTPTVPPAHDRTEVGEGLAGSAQPYPGAVRVPASVPTWTAYVVDTPAEAFYRHFTRCFICHFGDRYTEDHFCETGRELNIDILDDVDSRVEWR